MIADFPFLAGLASGVDRVVVEEGDAQVRIPSVLLPVIFPLFPTSVSNLSTDRATTSKIVQLGNTLINQAAGSGNVIVLPKGYYTLQYCVSARANFTTLVLADVVKLSVSYQGFTIGLASLMADSGTVNIEGSRDLLLTSDATVVMEFPPTNAAPTNSISTRVSLCVIRRV